MRKYGITFLALLLCLYVKGQTNTYPWPSSANVGIGTTSPTQRLFIQGSGNYNNSNAAAIALRSTAANRTIELHALDDGGFQIADRTNGKSLFWIDSNNDFHLLNGKVGIGIVNPTANLELYKYEGTNHFRISTNQHAGTAKIEIAGGVAGYGSQYSGWTISHSHNSTSKDLYFGYGLNPDTKVVFTDDGKVGIGANNPSYKLTVDGTISAKEVKVSTTPNSDYVFEPDYPLLPLSEVETHIKEKKHLPGIPSAEQFKENGVGLGEMDDMLLRKVEELVLYTIEQNKNTEKLLESIEELKQENEELNSANALLIKRIEKLENE